MKYIKFSDHADIIDYLQDMVRDNYISYVNDNMIEPIEIDERDGITHLIKLSNCASECAVCHARFLIESSKVKFCPNCGRHVIAAMEE